MGRLNWLRLPSCPRIRELGIGSVLVDTLIAHAAGPLYLRCASHNESYYLLWFSHAVAGRDACHLARAYQIGNPLLRLSTVTGGQERLVVMGIIEQ